MSTIKSIIPNIFELAFNNIHINAGYLDGKFLNSADVLEEILRSVAVYGTKLMKLKFTNINLNEERIIH